MAPMKLLYMCNNLYCVTVVSEVKGRQGNLKWGEDLLNAMKGREIRRGGM
jgi:hypothetical protein